MKKIRTKMPKTAKAGRTRQLVSDGTNINILPNPNKMIEIDARMTDKMRFFINAASAIKSAKAGIDNTDIHVPKALGFKLIFIYYFISNDCLNQRGQSAKQKPIRANSVSGKAVLASVFFISYDLSRPIKTIAPYVRNSFHDFLVLHQ
jgi:hypothetical protein